MIQLQLLPVALLVSSPLVATAASLHVRLSGVRCHVLTMTAQLCILLVILLYAVALYEQLYTMILLLYDTRMIVEHLSEDRLARRGHFAVL